MTLEEFDRHIVASATERIVVTNRAGKVLGDTESRHSIYTNGEWERQDYAYSQGGWAPKSVGIGPRYGFAVAKGSPDAPYNVFHLGDLDASGDDATIRKDLAGGTVRSFLEMPWALAGVRLADLLHEPNFSLKSVTSVSRDDKELVRIDFDWARPDKAFDGGSILLDPNDYWAAREHEIHAPRGPTQTIILYDHLEGIPVPHKIEATTRYDRDESLKDPEQYNGYVERTTFTFDKFEHKDVPAETFTLTAFGLPEREAETSWTAWLLIALGVLATAAAFYLLYRRRSAMV